MTIQSSVVDEYTMNARIVKVISTVVALIVVSSAGSAEVERREGTELDDTRAESWTCDIRNFGAIGDGVHLDTSAIQKAVDDCAAAGGGTREEAERRDLPELEDQYPEYFMWGVLPAYGLYARHVKGLAIDGVRSRWRGPTSGPQ